MQYTETVHCEMELPQLAPLSSPLLPIVTLRYPVKVTSWCLLSSRLQSVSRLFVNDYTVSGRCPIVTGTDTVTLGDCNQNLPFVCGPP